MTEWSWQRFTALDAASLYAVLELRQAVFVLEQQCLYPDIDGRDEDCFHLLGRDAAGRLVAYLRTVPPGGSYAEPSLGRIVTAADARGGGIGRALVLEGIARTRAEYPGQAIRISAQCYLEQFYQSLGFATVGQPYDEDGIPHIEMLLPAVS